MAPFLNKYLVAGIPLEPRAPSHVRETHVMQLLVQQREIAYKRIGQSAGLRAKVVLHRTTMCGSQRLNGCWWMECMRVPSA